MNTRKQFLRDGFGLAAILSAQSAPAILVRSMVAARNGIAAAKRGWVNPYVTDGLVAMWDGEWNAGGGVHDATATGWGDLTGRSPDIAIASGEVSWSNNALVRIGKGGRTVAYPNIDLSDPLSGRTIEFVISADDLPASPTTAYYFSSINIGGGSIRVTWQTSDPRLYYSLRAAGGMVNSTADSDTLSKPTTISLVGSGTSYSATRNIAYYYTNGVYITSASFGGDPITTPSLSLFQDVRSWPTTNTIRFHGIRFYARALTAAEIAANNAVDKARFNIA